MTLLHRNDMRLFLTSATLLFVELLLIRWVPSTILYVGFFSNFLLMASFLGIGLGILLGRAGRSLPLWPFALLLLGVVLVVTSNQLDVRVNSSNELFFGLTDASRAANTNYLVLPLVVGLVAAVMAALAVPARAAAQEHAAPARLCASTSPARWPASPASRCFRRWTPRRSSGSAWSASCSSRCRSACRASGSASTRVFGEA